MQEMRWIQNPLVVGRLLLLPFAAVQWIIVILHTRILRRFPRNVWPRIVSSLFAVILCFGVVVTQILIFSSITTIQHATSDYVVFLIVVLESLISIYLLLFGLKGQLDDRTGGRAGGTEVKS